jgi:hypothetical protein
MLTFLQTPAEVARLHIADLEAKLLQQTTTTHTLPTPTITTIPPPIPLPAPPLPQNNDKSKEQLAVEKANNTSLTAQVEKIKKKFKKIKEAKKKLKEENVHLQEKLKVQEIENGKLTTEITYLKQANNK